MRVRFWGIRGSIASPGGQTVRYGGNTSCIQVTAPSGEVMVLDAGTGIRALGQKLAADGPQEVALLITHTHWDHIQGFPYFVPIYLTRFKIWIYGPRLPHRSVEEIFSVFMAHEFHPVRQMELAAQIRYQDLGVERFSWGPFQVQTAYSHHPVVALSYRVSCNGKTLVYTGDHEPYFPLESQGEATQKRQRQAELQNQRYADFVRGADLLIADAMYTAEEYATKRLWGHSSIDDAMGLAARAEVKRLALFHLEPNYADGFLDGLAEKHLPALKEKLQSPALEVGFAKEEQEIAL